MWKHNRLNDQSFFLTVYPRGIVRTSLGNHRSVIAMQNELETCRTAKSLVVQDKLVDSKGKSKLVKREIGLPRGPAHKIEAWRGVYTLSDETTFRIMSMYSGNGYLILVGTMKDGVQNPATLQALVASANAGIGSTSVIDVASDADQPEVDETLPQAAARIAETVINKLTEQIIDLSALQEQTQRVSATLAGNADNPVTVDELQSFIAEDSGTDAAELWPMAINVLIARQEHKASLAGNDDLPLVVRRKERMYTADAVQTAWQQSLAANLGLTCVDKKYWALPWSVWQRILQESEVDSRKYQSDRFDCDDFAKCLAAEVSVKFQINSVGQVLDVSGSHAYCALLVFDDNSNLSVKFLEPQSDGIVEKATGQYTMREGFAIF